METPYARENPDITHVEVTVVTPRSAERLGRTTAAPADPMAENPLSRPMATARKLPGGGAAISGTAG
jgi:hypothetical protein